MPTSLKKNKTKEKALLCLSFSSDGIAYAYTDHPHTEAPIKHCGFLKCTEKKRRATLSAFVKENQLKNKECSIVLNPDEYSTLLFDAPNVKESEYQQAAKWLLKDLVAFPLSETIIDTFPTFSVTQKKKIYVVAAKEADLKIYARLIFQSNLKLTRIDITEMALRNILLLDEQKENGSALLYYFNNKLHILIYKDHMIYFTRAFFVNLKDNDDDHTQLFQEIQKSLDYYQSQMRQPAPDRLLLTKNLTAMTEIKDALTQNLSIPVETLALPEKMICRTAIPEKIQLDALNVIGETQHYIVNDLLQPAQEAAHDSTS
jgi:MSHA biogenesis protein MshI